MTVKKLDDLADVCDYQDYYDLKQEKNDKPIPDVDFCSKCGYNYDLEGNCRGYCSNDDN